jgi:hypothetical protein
MGIRRAAARRIRHAQETISLLQRWQRPPTVEDVVRTHELHAEHERELGRFANARRATERAERARRHRDG